FFSSRRRHTRCYRDWSSDVCSSDLDGLLRLAVDYSAREAIFRAACRFYKVTELSRDSFARVLGEVNHDGAADVDLLIRTGGEQRLSDFLLWESAYAELIFTPRMWPEFGAEDLDEAIAEF